MATLTEAEIRERLTEWSKDLRTQPCVITKHQPGDGTVYRVKVGLERILPHGTLEEINCFYLRDDEVRTAQGYGVSLEARLMAWTLLKRTLLLDEANALDDKPECARAIQEAIHGGLRVVKIIY